MKSSQFDIFKDALSAQVLAKSFQQFSDGSSELDEFVDYLAREAWSVMPDALRTASYEKPFERVSTLDLEILPFSFDETLVGYQVVNDRDDALKLLSRAMDAYIMEICAAPPVGQPTRTVECELCDREIPLTYHHLIPRSTHAKVLRRKWHPQERLNAVAWLCRYCHSMVHKVATNEELAQHFYTVDLLLAREDILKWKDWVCRQRYGKRRG